MLGPENMAYLNNLYPESFIQKAFDPTENKKFLKLRKYRSQSKNSELPSLSPAFVQKSEPPFILKDESDFTFTGSNMPQNDHYYSTGCRFTENA